MNIEKTRSDFPVLKRKINNKPVIYFDNAATSLKPIQVIEAMNDYYSNYSANVHRGIHKMSEEASEKFEQSHEKTAKFIGAKKEEVSFTKNTTESINSIMHSLLWNGNLEQGKIVLTEAEHHANLVPWQQAAKKKKLKTEFAKINQNFELDLNDLKNKIDKNTKIVAVAHAFNTIASINPVKEIAKIAHENNALFLVDGAQSIPHKKINVKDLGCDFFAFSSHKMLGPTGLGVLFGKEEIMKSLPPFLFGGSMIHSVSLNESSWNSLPAKFEAGTPPIAESIGHLKAIEYIEKISLEEINSQEKELLKYALQKLQEIDKIKIFCSKNLEKQTAIILFEIEGIHCHDLSLALDEMNNIALRSGMMCAEPIVSKYNKNGLNRISLAFYNTKQEIDVFIESLKHITKVFGK